MSQSDKKDSPKPAITAPSSNPSNPSSPSNPSAKPGMKNDDHKSSSDKPTVKAGDGKSSSGMSDHSKR